MIFSVALQAEGSCATVFCWFKRDQIHGRQMKTGTLLITPVGGEAPSSRAPACEGGDPLTYRGRQEQRQSGWAVQAPARLTCNQRSCRGPDRERYFGQCEGDLAQTDEAPGRPDRHVNRRLRSVWRRGGTREPLDLRRLSMMLSNCSNCRPEKLKCSTRSWPAILCKPWFRSL